MSVPDVEKKPLGGSLRASGVVPNVRAFSPGGHMCPEPQRRLEEVSSLGGAKIPLQMPELRQGGYTQGG